MRIKAYVGEKSPYYEMANGASEPIGYIKANSFVTLSDIKKDGINTYYMMDGYGYIKRSNIKILRDEEFFSSSALIKTKGNRSKANRYSMMRKNIAAVSFSTGIDMTVGGGFGGAYGQGVGNSSPSINGSMQTTWNQQTSIVPKYQGSDRPIVTGTVSGPKPPTPMQAIVGIGAGFIGSRGGVLGNLGSQMLGSFAATGSWDAANNMNLGSLFGNGTLGQLFNGATISNISDGSFFNSIFSQNAINIIGNLLSTLMQKLDYVVGFNLSGSLLQLFNGFARYGLSGSNGLQFTTDTSFLPNSRMYVNGDADARIRKYFKYKGDSNIQMISRGPEALLGGAIYGPTNYRTPTLGNPQPNQKEVEFHRSIYENMYTEYAEQLNKIRASVNLDITRSDWFYNFNRFRLIHPDSVLGNTKGYIFFTRPDLNLASPSGITSDIGLLINAMVTQHPGIVAGLQKSPSLNGVSFDNGHKFIPLLCNRCTGIDINDETLETKEIGDTYTGWKLNYGTTTIKSKAANSVTTSFIDDEQLSIYLTFKLWEEYISNVSRGVIAPKNEYVKTTQLDYANSIYYFLTAQDGQSILFWTKFTGCIPTNIPSSNFTDSIDTPVRMPKYSITWQYAFKKDYDPYTLAEFNKLAEGGGNFEAMPMYDAETIRSARTIVGSPYVDTKTGGQLYRLLFRKAANNFGSDLTSRRGVN